ncbi:DUF3732 domain-containing protein [Sporosarcina sp. Marseille-Q4063]|uniref:DUF3732 domain-containing protein n=1 Tax=Sporosarcina sp. Marseille-Q4063 TaxID=2810514 RepID=UPI001BAEE136|nr:DUF3732 domain-containing protein [Sporosarcina sp. Marseille-Q4063]QUW23054.1 DUF3732 domain-containing protein [Sporosarcina sp. Marseille-Q4063]
MRFFIKQLTLWLKNGSIRKLEFKENKINVITGASGTGKTEIMAIIDYCFFASGTKIADEKINENVNWYGITFEINKSTYTIARESFIDRKGSDVYYFSPIGVIPNLPFENNNESNIKKVIENEFSIDKNLVIPYGGSHIRAGTKISFKYFQLFTSQSENVIVNSEVYFDKQNIGRYREALERVFDVAFKIDTVENMLINEKINDLVKGINRLERKQTIFDNEKNVFLDNMKRDIKRARELQLLLDDEYIPSENYLKVLKSMTGAFYNFNISKEKEKLINERNTLLLKTKNLKRLESEYKKYIEVEKNIYDSLKPIVYIKENFSDLLSFPETAMLVQILEKDFKVLKKKNSAKQPFNINIKSELENYIQRVKEIDRVLGQYPKESSIDNNIYEQMAFIGELRYKINLYENTEGLEDYTAEISSKKDQLKELKSNVLDVSGNRALFVNLLESLIQNYLEEVGDALGIYKGYRAVFNYASKSIELRRPNTLSISHVGSSSNHLFMHLCLFLALHEASIIQKSEYIPQYLILDQPSRPYYGDEKDYDDKDGVFNNSIVESDKYKIRKAMILLDEFICKIKSDYNKDFQIILLEHIPKSVWEGLNNFHLVEEFRNGNALIREKDDML